MPAESFVRCGVNMSATEHASLSDEAGVMSTKSITQDAKKHTNKMSPELLKLLEKWDPKITGEDLAKTSIEHSRDIENILGAWKYNKESPETTKCEHRCPRGNNGRIPGTSAYGEMIQNANNKKEKVCRCMNFTEGDTETYVDCRTKLFFCSLYCPFTNFEQYAKNKSGNPLNPGWTNPVIFHGKRGIQDMKIVISDHIKGPWHHFWEAVYLHSEGQNSSLTDVPEAMSLSFLFNFRCVLDLAIFHAMLNYNVDENNVPVNCEINQFIIENGKKFKNAMKFLQTKECKWLSGNTTYLELMQIQQKKLQICCYTYEFGVCVRKNVKQEVQNQIIAMYTEPMDFDEKTSGLRKNFSSKIVQNTKPTATTVTAKNSHVCSPSDSDCFQNPASGALTQSIVSAPHTNEIQLVESLLEKIEQEKKASSDHVMKIHTESQRMLQKSQTMLLESQQMLLESQKKVREYKKAFIVHNEMLQIWNERTESQLEELQSLESSNHDRMQEEASKESVQDSIPSAETPEIGVLEDTEQIAWEDSASNSTPNADNTTTRVREDTENMSEGSIYKRPRLLVQSDVGASGTISHVDSLNNVLYSKKKQSSADVQSNADVQGHEMSNADESISDAAKVLLSFNQ